MNAQERIDTIIDQYNEHASASDKQWSNDFLEFDMFAQSYHAFMANAISSAVSRSTDQELKKAFQERAI